MLERLVLGIGNILLRDEGVGVHVVETMSNMELPDDVELVDGGTSGADLVDVIANRRQVIVVDAIEAGIEPGSVLRMSAEDLLPSEGGSISLHQLGLVEALHMAKVLECAPPEVVVFGIQPGNISPGLGLTPPVVKAVPKTVLAILKELSSVATTQIGLYGDTT